MTGHIYNASVHQVQHHGRSKTHGIWGEGVEEGVVAHDYVRYNERLEQSATDLDSKKQRHNDLEEATTRLKSEITHLEEDVKRVSQVECYVFENKLCSIITIRQRVINTDS